MRFARSLQWILRTAAEYLAPLILTLAVNATPPDSLVGLVYRDEVASRVREYQELSLDLRNSGRFSSFLWSHGTTITESLYGYNAPIAGTYVYEKTGDNQYRLVLTNEADGTLVELRLTFETDTSGRVSRGRVGPVEQTYSGMFWLSPAPNDEQRTLINASARVVVKAGEPTILGFVIPGQRRRDVLIRVIGPGLASMGVSDFWANPTYALPGILRQSQLKPDASSADYGTWSWSPEAQATNERAFARCGAFPLAPKSHDLADVKRLGPGVHTVVVTPSAGSSDGTALIEIYEL